MSTLREVIERACELRDRGDKHEGAPYRLAAEDDLESRYTVVRLLEFVDAVRELYEAHRVMREHVHATWTRYPGGETEALLQHERNALRVQQLTTVVTQAVGVVVVPL